MTKITLAAIDRSRNDGVAAIRLLPDQTWVGYLLHPHSLIVDRMGPGDSWLAFQERIHETVSGVEIAPFATFREIAIRLGVAPSLFYEADVAEDVAAYAQWRAEAVTMFTRQADDMRAQVASLAKDTVHRAMTMSKLLDVADWYEQKAENLAMSDGWGLTDAVIGPVYQSWWDGRKRVHEYALTLACRDGRASGWDPTTMDPRTAITSVRDVWKYDAALRDLSSRVITMRTALRDAYTRAVGDDQANLAAVWPRTRGQVLAHYAILAGSLDDVRAKAVQRGVLFAALEEDIDTMRSAVLAVGAHIMGTLGGTLDAKI